MRVRNVMKVQVHTCREGETLNEAANLMWQHDVGALPVVDRMGRVVAVLTDRDIALSAFLTGEPLAKIDIADAMSKRVHSCSAEQTIEEAEAAMRTHQVRRLPVVDDQGQLVGIVTLTDLARVARLSPELPCVDVVRTLGEITTPKAMNLAKA